MKKSFIDNTDIDFIYDEVRDLYKPYGRESIDPVVLIKIVMIQYLFGIHIGVMFLFWVGIFSNKADTFEL